MLSVENPMSQNVMSKIFVGEEGSKCDGNIYGYSTFMHILKSKPTRVADRTFYQMITINFQCEKHNFDYKFQHTYKRLSIQGYFTKDLLFSLVLVFGAVIYPIMQIMNSMRNANLPPRDDPEVNFDEEMRKTVREWISSYQIIILMTAGSYLFQVPQRILFNLLPRKNTDLPAIPFDQYLRRDMMFSCSVIVVYLVLLIFGESWAIDDTMRSFLIIICVVAIVLGLIKFGFMFLCVEEFSVLLQTMFSMLADTVPILLILLAWLIIYLQFSLTIYTDSIPAAYDQWHNATRVSFDFFLGSYDYSVMSSEFVENTMAKYIYYLVCMLNLFIACILMLNFMIAILSDSYATMQELGSFYFKCA